jgi:hypothetical protein
VVGEIMKKISDREFVAVSALAAPKRYGHFMDRLQIGKRYGASVGKKVG